MRRAVGIRTLLAATATAFLPTLSLIGCSPPARSGPPSFVGRAVCGGCHEKELRLWTGSDHDLAMDVATEKSVLGDFDNTAFRYYGTPSTFFRRDGKFLVRTDGADGALREFEIAYTFGVRPLQQYLARFPRGRYQALTICWDTRPEGEGGRRWFHLYPREPIRHDDLLHWTKPSGTWNFMCAGCHSTGVKKNYDLDNDSYATTWFEIDVSCEACHGPGSRHAEWAQENPGRKAGGGEDIGLTVRPRDAAMEEACFPCHARRIVLDDAFVPGTPFLDAYLPLLLTRELYHPDGQILEEVYEYGSFLQSRMRRAGVRCIDCHDPHTLKPKGEGNGVCARCHASASYDAPRHHHHRGGSAGARCVACHMPARNYMVVDPRLDHSIRVPRPDLSVKLSTPDPCTGCHKGKGAAWAAAAVERWRGPGKPLPPHFGEAIEAGRRGAPGSAAALAKLALDNTQAGIVRAAALHLLRDKAAPSLIPAFRSAVHDPDPLVRGAAVSALAAYEPRTRWRLAFHLLSDPVRSVRFQAAPVLAGIPRSELAPDQAAALDRAVEEYEKANLANADMAPYHINLGVIRHRTGRTAQAEAAYRDAIRLDPAFAPAYVNLADLYRERREDDKGEAILRQGLAANPKAGELHYALGLLLVRGKRLAEAVTPLEIAASLRPDEPRYPLAHALALEAVGRRSQAMAALRKAYARHPFDRELLYTLATMSRDRGKRGEALRYAREFDAVAPEESAAKSLLAELEPGAR